MNSSVSPKDLQDLVDRCGEDPIDWPSNWRAPARALVDECEEAQDILDQARRLRNQLGALGLKAPALFADRVVAVALVIDPPEGGHFPLS